MTPRYSRGARRHKLPRPSPSQNPAHVPADEIEAARAICEAYAGGVHRGGGIPAVAVKIGMKPGVLYNKLAGAEDSHHKPTIQDFKLIHLATGRIDHLQALARGMGCVAFPIPDLSRCSDEALLDLVARIQVEEGEYHGLLSACLSDGEIDTADAQKLERALFDWLGAIVEAHTRVKGLARG